MTEETKNMWICFGIIMGLFFALYFLTTIINNRWEQVVVKHGCAEYIMNKENGKTFWEWKD